MAVDAASLVDAVELAGVAVGLVGGACLLIPVALLAYREMRNMIDGGASLSPRQVAAIKAKERVAAMEAEAAAERDRVASQTEVSYRAATSEEQLEFDAGGAEGVDEDLVDEHRFRNQLADEGRFAELAARERDFDEFGSRRPHAEAAHAARKGF